MAASRDPSARTPNSMKEANLAWTFASPLNRCQVAKADLRICPPPPKESFTPRPALPPLFLSILNLLEASGHLVKGSGIRQSNSLELGE